MRASGRTPSRTSPPNLTPTFPGASLLTSAGYAPPPVPTPSHQGPDAQSPPGSDSSAGPDAAARRFVRRQRRDTLAALRLVRPALFRPRLSRNPAAIALVAVLILAPVVLLPNPQDAAIAQARQV